jgi:hypothetical protein
VASASSTRWRVRNALSLIRSEIECLAVVDLDAVDVDRSVVVPAEVGGDALGGGREVDIEVGGHVEPVELGLALHDAYERGDDGGIGRGDPGSAGPALADCGVPVGGE